MGRPMRSQQQSGFHHVMNRGAGRRVIFRHDRDRVAFGRALAEACERTSVEVHAYCLMPNHFHLLVRCPTGHLSEMVQWLTAVWTRRTNQRWGSDGPILRGRFRSKAVTTDAYLLALVRYIHRNPLPLLGDAPLETYRWSSMRTYLGHRQVPAWMRTGIVLGMLGDDRTSFMRFHDESDDRVPDPGIVDHLAEFALDEVTIDSTVGPKLARTLALVVADELGADAGPLIASLGFDNESRARQAQRRAQRRAAELGFLREAARRITRDAA